jgi:hypothetical protein
VVRLGAGDAAVELVVADGGRAVEEVRPAVLPDHVDLAQRRQLRLERPDVVAEAAGPEPRLGEHHRDPGQLGHEGQLTPRGEGGHRHRDRPGHGRAEDRRQRLGPVAHHDADRVAPLDPGGHQRPGHPPGLGTQVGVRPADRGAGAERVVEHDGVVAGVAAGDLLQEAPERQRADAVDRVDRGTVEGRHRTRQLCAPVPNGAIGPSQK